jgi:pimeloyl-ACP methyl ester carboxylesterase
MRIMEQKNELSRLTASRSSRRAFLRSSAASVVGLGAVKGMADEVGTPAPRPPGGAPRFFRDPMTSFTFLCALGRTYYTSGNIGKLLYLAGQIEDDNAESGFQAYKKAADEARSLAESAERRGHKVSARQAYSWAADWYFTATYFVDGTVDPSRFLPTFESYWACWEKEVALCPSPVERVKIPYEQTALEGFFFRVDGSRRKRPLMILNNGSDGSAHDLWAMGAAGGLARGYNCLIFDGPGQGYALWKQKLYFRPDWERVITPVVEFALTRREVDPKRIALQGVSQGGYWVPRAVAFEHRIAAAIADPGVTDVSGSWIAALPKPLVELLQSGRKEEFDEALRSAPSAEAAALRFRMRPYGLTSPYDVYKAAEAYNLTGVAEKIRCPMLITSPEGEQFWPGQSQALYDLLRCPKTLVPFTAEEGADLHCEPTACGLRDIRVYDWLDETLRG